MNHPSTSPKAPAGPRSSTFDDVSGRVTPSRPAGAAAVGRVSRFELVERAEPAVISVGRLSFAPLPPVRLGIRLKLVGAMAVMIGLIVAVLTSSLAARGIAEARLAAKERALVYASLAGKQLRSVVAFEDRETAREVLSAVANDGLIDGITVYGSSGRVIYAEGRLSELAKRITYIPVKSALAFQLPGRILAVAPVVSLEGVRGSVVLELSTRAVAALRDKMVLTSSALGGAVLLAGALLGWFIARSIAHRIELVASAATKMAKGDLDHALRLDGPNDEIGILIRTFNAMSGRVSELVAHIRQGAREENVRLERLVSQRTEQLNRRNDDLRLVLDMVEQGFVVIDAAARPLGEYSRVIEEWIGPLRDDSTLWQQLTRSQPAREEAFALAWEQVEEQLLPLEFTLAQLPRELVLSGRHLSIEYRPVQQQSLDKVLVVISDVTARVAHAESEQEGRELLSITRSILSDRAAFIDFFVDGKRLVENIDTARDPAERARDLHTLKGNASLFGLGRVVAVCHELENSLVENAGAGIDFERLRSAWSQCDATVKKLVIERSEATLEISRAEHGALMEALGRGVAHEELVSWIGSFALEPLRVRLERAALQLVAGAERLGKGRAVVTLRNARIYLEREELGEFWASFAHVVRNAVVYGLREPTDAQRLATQARGLPDFELEGGLKDGAFFVELRDFGPGVDFAAIAARAKARGLPHETPADLEAALFSDGVSSRGDADEFAGRGVGLSAVRSACLRRQGTVSVRAAVGGGTRFRFSWPLRALPSFVHLGGERGS